jgi:NADPH:quinone reductase-like Zn-dependent oxidoreductase
LPLTLLAVAAEMTAEGVNSMTRFSKIGGGILALVVLVLGSLAFMLSHDSAPAPERSLPSNAIRMKAIVHRQYGSPDVLELKDVEKPSAADNQLLIRVHAAAANPIDWHYMRGTPYIVRMRLGLGRPKFTRLGLDFAGTVEAVGKNVRRFKAGDEIFGVADGAFAEYVTSTEEGLALKPSNMTFEQAASVPVAAITALQGLRDKGQIKPAQKVLINGASGGVGTFAVQIAKSFGAEVTGVCSTRNLEMVRSIGADHVIDYTKEDFTQGVQRYDLIFDTVGNHPLLEYRRVLNPKGIFVIVGGPNDGRWIGPLINPIKAFLISPFVSQTFVTVLADANKTDDLNTLRDLMQAGKLTPVLDRQYTLPQVPEAIRYLEAGHARGKVVIRLE